MALKKLSGLFLHMAASAIRLEHEVPPRGTGRTGQAVPTSKSMWTGSYYLHRHTHIQQRALGVNDWNAVPLEDWKRLMHRLYMLKYIL